MSDLTPSAASRPRRADARQNSAAILEAAARLLAENPQAGMSELARAAGMARQTVYAHFPTRDALINALIERATERVLAAIEDARLHEGPADQALVRLLEAGWRSFDADPFLLHLAQPPVTPEKDRERHAPILKTLADLVARGQREGDIDPDLAPGWILASTLALGHAAGEEVRAGRMTSAEAVAELRRSIPRLVRPAHEHRPA